MDIINSPVIADESIETKSSGNLKLLSNTPFRRHTAYAHTDIIRCQKGTMPFKLAIKIKQL